MSLKEIMHKPTFVDKNATVSETAKIMAEKCIGSVLVGRPENVLGIFSERDLLVKVAAKNIPCKKAKVKHYMNSPVKTIDINCSVFDAQNIMIETRIRRLPVTNSGKVVGIVSARTLMQHLKYEYLTKRHNAPIRELYSGYW